jgi:hypothetical protein
MKAKAKRKQGRPRKELKDTAEIRSSHPIPPQFTVETNTEMQIQAYEDFLTATPRISSREEGEAMSLGDLLQSAPILGKKRAREVEPHVSRNIFQEEIAAGILETGKIRTNDLVTVEADGGIQYQFFHKIDGKIQRDEPVYTACIDYLHLKEGNEMFSFAAHTSIRKALQLYPEVALQSLINEIDGMLTRKVWKGVLFENLTKKQQKEILYSSTIVKEKYNLDGEPTSMKTRVVTGGDGQKLEDIPERLRSAPTTATSSVNTIASIAASRNMEVGTVDIKQAYLNADMESDVFMWIPQPMADVLCERDKDFLPFLDKNGKVLVKLLKAQYGCVESAKLWYNHISKAIISYGFQVNPFDQCLFQKQEGEIWTYITLYVDDLLIVSDDKNRVDETIQRLRDTYTDITVTRGKIHEYTSA